MVPGITEPAKSLHEFPSVQRLPGLLGALVDADLCPV
jgi:hypothetical protein